MLNFVLHRSGGFCEELNLLTCRSFVERVVYLATDGSDAGTIGGAPAHLTVFLLFFFNRRSNA